MAIGFQAWKLKLQQSEAQKAIDEAAAAAAAADAAAATADSKADDAQLSANEGVQVAGSALDAAVSAKAYADAQAATASKVAPPGITVSGIGQDHIRLSCATSGATIYYQLNGTGGSWTTYTGIFTCTNGDWVYAYAAKAGLTDSIVVSLNTGTFPPITL